MNTATHAPRVAATGEKAHLMEKVLFYGWLLVPAYQYSDLHVQNSRVGFWGIATALFFIMSMRDLLRRRFILPSRALVIPFSLVFGWKLIELFRSPAPVGTALLFFFDFLITYVTYFLIAPRIVSASGWLTEFRLINVFILAISILAHPFIPPRTDMAGWDKGYSWAFAHPNIAAMYPLSIYLISLIILGTGVRRLRWFDVFCIVFSLVTLAMTASRTAQGIAVVATVMSLGHALAFKYFHDRHGRDVRALKLLLKVVFALVIGAGSYFAVLSIGEQKIDADFSGRWSFAVQVLFSAKNLILGVGLLPPGGNLIADNSARGAGIDGLYTNLIYSEGYVGLVLFSVVMIGLSRMARSDARFSAYFSVALWSGLLFGITESHFWLLPGPLTALVAVLAGTLGTQSGGYKIVRLVPERRYYVGKVPGRIRNV